MHIAMHGVKLHAHYYTWSERLMLNPIHGVTHCAHCYTWSEALCSLLYME